MKGQIGLSLCVRQRKLRLTPRSILRGKEDKKLLFSGRTFFWQRRHIALHFFPCSNFVQKCFWLSQLILSLSLSHHIAPGRNLICIPSSHKEGGKEQFRVWRMRGRSLPYQSKLFSVVQLAFQNRTWKLLICKSSILENFNSIQRNPNVCPGFCLRRNKLKPNGEKTRD